MDLNYSEDLVGFVIRESGIGLQEWSIFAESSDSLIKQPPVEGVNPFTGKPHLYTSNRYWVTNGNEEVGIACWEEAECIGIAGDLRDLDSFVSELCSAFDARYEEV